MTTENTAQFTAPGLSDAAGKKAVTLLKERLVALLDLQLTLKHVHWNVVGPNFIGVHEMLDPQVESVREMSDTVAERIATLGGVPEGTPDAISSIRSWSDYSLGRATVTEHLSALDAVYSGVNESHRKAIDETAKLDPVSEDMLTSQLADLEQYQWFVRAHLQNSDGALASVEAKTNKAA
jgi:starvation-inducible DNA-binding protein